MLSIREAQPKDKRVLLRVDFNLPLKNGKITSTFRLRAALASIRYLLARQAKIILISHLGRPNGFDRRFSLEPIVLELKKHFKVPIFWTEEVLSMAVRKKVENLDNGEILVLGNLRYLPEEEANDLKFAKGLSGLADIYVNDAFSCSHRAHASIVGVTKFLPSYAGLRMEEEIESLDRLLTHHPKPFLVLIGGAKLEDKIDTLKNILPIAERVALGGGTANTFLMAKGEEVSESLYEESLLDFAKEMMRRYPEKLILPIDWLVEYLPSGGFKISDVGPLTLALLEREIAHAKTIFLAGNFGISEDERFRGGTEKILRTMAKTLKRTIISGGDTVGLAEQLNLISRFAFASTGGGATLEFLAGKPLPGLEALKERCPYCRGAFGGKHPSFQE